MGAEGRGIYPLFPSVSWLSLVKAGSTGIQLSLKLSCPLTPPRGCGAAIFYAPSKVARCFLWMCSWWAEPVPLQVSSETLAWAAVPPWLLYSGHSRRCARAGPWSTPWRRLCLQMVADMRPQWEAEALPEQASGRWGQASQEGTELKSFAILM